MEQIFRLLPSRLSSASMVLFPGAITTDSNSRFRPTAVTRGRRRQRTFTEALVKYVCCTSAIAIVACLASRT